MTQIVTKEWILYKSDPDQNDYTWIEGLGCRVQIERDDPQEIVSQNGRVYQYMGRRPRLLIYTICEKQESMLKLKYGDELALQSSFHETTGMRFFEP